MRLADQHVAKFATCHLHKLDSLFKREISQSYCDVAFPTEGVALVLGNEEIGVDTRVLSAADATVEIPTFGRKNSLNIAAAAPVVVFEVLRQWGFLGAGG